MEQRGGARWRAPLSATLIVIGCIIAPLAGLAIWASNQITSTDRYVHTVTPLASSVNVQHAITDRVTDEVVSRVDVNSLTQQAAQALNQLNLPPDLAKALTGLTGTIKS